MRFYLRRLTSKNGQDYLVWHDYATKKSRDKWANIYMQRGNTVWMNEDGSTDGLFFLKDENGHHI